MRYRTILLFGAPGAGKGTQGKILGKIPGFVHFACGEAFRNLRLDNALGRIFLDYSSKGLLVPDEPTIEFWKSQVDGMIATGQFHPETEVLILDGIPRNPNQARIMKDLIDVHAVFNLFCPVPEKLILRLQRRALRENRMDDAKIETIRMRMDTYRRETRAVLDCYPEQIIHQIDSTQEPLLVLLDILKVLARVARPRLNAPEPALPEPAPQ